MNSIQQTLSDLPIGDANTLMEIDRGARLGADFLTKADSLFGSDVDAAQKQLRLQGIELLNEAFVMALALEDQDYKRIAAIAHKLATAHELIGQIEEAAVYQEYLGNLPIGSRFLYDILGKVQVKNGRRHRTRSA